ncbi:MAG: hypothetical protein II123_03395 [Lachnospiraceae bacterium]|nr:hypothetical protein [Lachnospiraceae bacterium]
MNLFNKDHNKYLVILFSAIMLIIILIVGRIGQKKAQEKSPEAVQETSQVIDRTDTDHTENTTPTEPASAGDSSAPKENSSASLESSGSSLVSVSSLSAARKYSQLIIVGCDGGGAQISMYENSGDSSTWNQILSSPGYIGSDGVGQASEDSCHTPQGIYGFTMAFGNLPDPGSAIPYTQTDANSYWVDDPDSLFYNRFVYVTDASATADNSGVSTSSVVVTSASTTANNSGESTSSVVVTKASTPSAETTVTPDVLVNDPNYLSGRILLSPSIHWNSAENLHDAGYAYNYALALDVNSNCTPGAGSAFFLHCNINKPTQGCITVPEDVMRDILINIKPDCHIIIDTAERLKQY